MMAESRACLLLASGVACSYMLVACSLLVSTDGLSSGAPDAEAADAGLDATAAGDTTNEPEAAPSSSGSDAANERDAEGSLADSSTGADGMPSDGPASDRAAPEAQAGESGVQDAPADAPACRDDLSNIGTNDFHVSLSVSTVQTGLTALVNQRARCVHGLFWDIRLASGSVQVETDDGVTPYVELVSTGAPVNDGSFHELSVSRVAGTLTISIDGAPSGSTSSPTSFGVLPPLAIGSDHCEIDGGGTVAFVGTVRDVCVASP